MVCPHCGSPMTADTLQTRVDRTVTVDRCDACQLFWFDTHESLQLSPAATLKLFRIIGGQAAQTRPAPLKSARCPRCRLPLALTHDMQRNTRFTYWMCERDGRLIGFYDFLREKDFIRPLTPAQIAELRRNVGEMNCSNCGAPIDLATSQSCPHCGTPLSMLDLPHAEQLIAELRQGGNSGRPSPAGVDRAGAVQAALVPLALARDRPAAAGSTDLVSEGLTALLRRLLAL